MMADILHILESLAKPFEHLPHPTAIFSAEADSLHLVASSKLETNKESLSIDLSGEQRKELLSWDKKIFNLENNTKQGFFEFLSNLGFAETAIHAISAEGTHYGLVAVGCASGQNLDKGALQPYFDTIEIASKAIQQSLGAEKAKAEIEQYALEKETMQAVMGAVKTPWDTKEFFAALHEQVRKLIGDFAFIGALYNEKTASISIPYLKEEGQTRSIESFPVGEGLTSVLLRTKQPLLLVENTMEQAQALGAKVDGKPASSWMGAPILVGDLAIGALIVQDLDREQAFTQENMDALTSLANMVSKIVYNAQILDEHRNQISKIQTSAEIARDISSALNLDELLLKAINLIRERFDFYHAAVFLIDSAEKFAVIREATGEAGAQMKRSGHKLAVGSKSIVGFVSKQGEALVVNDTTKDATHMLNPMLSDTRAEAAIPMKIGERILGVLDVQSTVPFSFTPNDITTFQILADQLAIAVNNTELFAETQEHLSQHRLLHHITTSAASGTTLDEALNAAVEGLQVTLGGDRVSILLSDEERKNLLPKAWVGYSDEIKDLSIPFGTGVTGWVAARRKPLRINDIEQDTRYIEVSANTKSELALPLIFRNDILGVLNVESEQFSAYTDNDEEMLGTLAGSLAAIIANARLVEQIRKQAERERQLYEISSKIRRSTDTQTILATTVNELKNATGARRAQITIGVKKDGTTELTRSSADSITDRKE